MAEDFDEKTEEATPKKKQESKEQGEVPRSKDLTTLLMLVSGSCAILFWGKYWADSLFDGSRSTWILASSPSLMPGQLLAALIAFMQSTLWSLAPFLGLMLLTALLAPALLGGWSFSSKALQPKFNRLDPIKGTARLFSLRSLVELLKTLGKFAVVMGAGVTVFLLMQGEFLQLGSQNAPSGITHAADILARGLLLISSSLLLIALIDAPYQLWDHNRKQRMTKQEIKDEHKQSEGDPQLKARVRQVQREMANRRMMGQVADADVIITNPDHYAVALKYDSGKMAAPKMVAKGKELTALKIKELAIANQVPIVRAPVLSRALYFTGEIDQVIPQGLFLAVAQVLAYLYQLDRNWAGKKGPKSTETNYPGNLSIPEDYLKAANRPGPGRRSAP